MKFFLSISIFKSHEFYHCLFFFLRGQESAGIVTSEGFSRKNFKVHKGMGLVTNVFTEEVIQKLKGKSK